MRACFGCHGNETIWPWYSNVALVFWLVRRDAERALKAKFLQTFKVAIRLPLAVRKVKTALAVIWYGKLLWK